MGTSLKYHHTISDFWEAKTETTSSLELRGGLLLSFKANKKKVFSKDREWFMKSYQPQLLVGKRREKYGGEEMSLESNNNCFVKVGISRLVEEGTFNAAFPLHDVSIVGDIVIV